MTGTKNDFENLQQFGQKFNTKNQKILEGNFYVQRSYKQPLMINGIDIFSCCVLKTTVMFGFIPEISSSITFGDCLLL